MSLRKLRETQDQEATKARLSRTRIPLAVFLRDHAPTYEKFVEFLKVGAKNGKVVPFRLNECQRRYNAARTRRDIVLKARQQGFTTEGLARDLWFFLKYPNENVLVVCQSINHSAALKDVCDKLRDLVKSLREKVDLRFSTETNTDWRLDGRKGSLRVIEAGASSAAAQKKGRAGTIGRLHLTEVAFWEFAGETLNAMFECVPPLQASDHSEIEIESTANGAAPACDRNDRNVKGANGSATFHWRYEDARDGFSEYRAHFFEWWITEEYAAPLKPGEVVEPDPADPAEARLVAKGLTPEQLKFRRVKRTEKGPDTFDQEYPSDDVTCFLLSGRTFFDKAATKRLLEQATPAKESRVSRSPGAIGEVRIWHRPEPKVRYVIPADTSEGSGGDSSAAHVYEMGTGRHMASLDGQFKPWELAKALAQLGRLYNWALVAVERNNHGSACLRALEVEAFPVGKGPQKYPRIFYDRDDKPGWLNSSATRPAALDTLEQAHRSGGYQPNDVAIVRQMRVFVVNDNGKPEAQRGSHDDHVMTAMIGWDVLTRPAPRAMDLEDLPAF